MSTAATDTKKGIGRAAMYDVAAFDELKQLGFRAEKLDDTWSAYRIDGTGEPTGPAKTLAALLTQVKLEIGNKIELPADAVEAKSGASEVEADTEEIELAADSNGNAFLPGTAPRVNKQLSAAILKYHSIKMDRVALTAQETAARDEMKTIAHIHDALYVPDPKKPTPPTK